MRRFSSRRVHVFNFFGWKYLLSEQPSPLPYSFTKFPLSSIMSILQKDFLIASRHASRDISSFFSGLTSILKTNSDNKQSNYPAEYSIVSNFLSPSVPSWLRGYRGIAGRCTPSSAPAPA